MEEREHRVSKKKAFSPQKEGEGGRAGSKPILPAACLAGHLPLLPSVFYQQIAQGSRLERPLPTWLRDVCIKLHKTYFMFHFLGLAIHSWGPSSVYMGKPMVFADAKICPTLAE